MALITISSRNPKFSWILGKNPETIQNSGPFKKTLRKGTVFGWYPSKVGDQFRLWFKDSSTASSFAENQEFEYLDIERYGNPYLIMSMIDTAVKLKFNDDDTEDYECSVSFDMIISNENGLLNLAEHYRTQGTSIELEVHRDLGMAYKVCIRAPSVIKALMLSQLVCLTSCLTFTHKKLPYITTEFVVRWAKVMNSINAPYYIRYRLSSLLIDSKAQFNQIKDCLCNESITINYGDTQEHRYAAISKVLRSGKTLVDLGCGGLFYSKRLAQNYNEVFAIEAEAKTHNKNQQILQRSKIDNVVPIHQLIDANYIKDSPSMFDGSVVLMTEVAEHIEQQEAADIIEAVLASNVDQLVVTVPNSEFNKHYYLDGFRHPDHKWEPTSEQFHQWIYGMAGRSGKRVNIQGIGDSVDGTFVSLMAVFEGN